MILRARVPPQTPPDLTSTHEYVLSVPGDSRQFACSALPLSVVVEQLYPADRKDSSFRIFLCSSCRKTLPLDPPACWRAGSQYHLAPVHCRSWLPCFDWHTRYTWGQTH